MGTSASRMRRSRSYTRTETGSPRWSGAWRCPRTWPSKPRSPSTDWTAGSRSVFAIRAPFSIGSVTCTLIRIERSTRMDAGSPWPIASAATTSSTAAAATRWLERSRCEPLTRRWAPLFRAPSPRLRGEGRGEGRRLGSRLFANRNARLVERRLLHDVHGRGNHGTDISDVGRHDHRRTDLRQLAELVDVCLGNAELHGFRAARNLHRFGHPTDAFRRGRRHRQNRGGLTLGLVDVLLLLRFGGLDHLLLLA